MLIPVIMAGGSGTRLWPMSRKFLPKQFLPLATERTMLQETVMRLDGLALGKPIVVCGDEHRFLAAEQLREIGVKADILLEPEGKNTAPAIALAANAVLNRQPASGNDMDEPVLLVLAADHIIKDASAFQKAILQAQKISTKGQLVTFGIVPTEPHTGYGYIEKGTEGELDSEFAVKSFVEKPDVATAETYLSSGNYLWNSGMFLFEAKQFLTELQTYAPTIAEPCELAVKNSEMDLDFIRVDAAEFVKSEEDSIDYAVMEKTQNASVIPLDAGWSDIGSWTSLWDTSEKDAQGNVIQNCQALTENTSNCMISGDQRLVATLGLQDLIIIDTKDALLVADKTAVQDVKTIVKRIKASGSDQHEFHRVVYRPWGKYDSIDKGHRYQVKHITVKPGEKLSIQMHHHRAEHWVVVSGMAKVTRDKETIMVAENESVYLPIGSVHCLENPGKIPVELIEVQVGSYLGEDDIVRFEDKYGRIKK